MTTLPIPAGPTNRKIIDRAYQVLGTSDAMFGRTESEYADAMLTLQGMMAQYPFDRIGFIYEPDAGLRIEEESGIAFAHLNAVAYTLAEQMAPTMGKTLSPEARKQKNRAYSSLCAEVGTPPQKEFNDGTPRGSGHRYRYQTYFPPSL